MSERFFKCSHRPTEAFTLLEVLIAIAILSIIITSTLTIFRGASSAWRKGEARTAVFQSARAVLDTMSREIRSGMVTNYDNLIFLGTAKSLFFISPSKSEAQSDLMEVGYWLRDKDNTLMKHIDTNPDYDFSTADANDELAENVSDLNFQYFDGTVWEGSWNSKTKGSQNKLPKAVKIILTISDEGGHERRTVETIVGLSTAR